ncbi:hypothetical protein CWI42_091230 [Ordospora colligata]|nr:hypothetical protein CWI42_091230 [Ordospora colligata]
MHGKTINGACGYEELDTIWCDDSSRLWQGIDVNGSQVIIFEKVMPGLHEKERIKLVSLLMGHAMNARSNALRVSKCFWIDDVLYMIHEGAVHVNSRIMEKYLVDENLGLWIFVQAVYVVGMNIDDEWLCNKISMKSMCIANDGRLLIRWSDIILNFLMMSGNEEKLIMNEVDWSRSGIKGCEVQCEQKYCGTSGTNCGLMGANDRKSVIDRPIMFPMVLKGMFLELMKCFLRVSDMTKDAEKIDACSDNLERHKLDLPMKSFLNDCQMMVDMLFVKGVHMNEVKRWIELMHEASGKSIQKICNGFRNRYKGEITDSRSTPALMDEADNSNGETGNSSMEEESSKNTSDGEYRTRSFGTREYKRGRFHVCEAVPLGDKDKEVKTDEYVNKMLKMLNLQSRKIGIIANAIHRMGNFDGNEKNELACLEEECRILMSDLER